MIDSITLAFFIVLFLLLIPVALLVLLYFTILAFYLIAIGYAAIMVAVKNTVKAIKRRRLQQVLAPAKRKALDRMALLYGTSRHKKKLFGFINVKESDEELRLRLQQIIHSTVRTAFYQTNSEIRDRV